MPHTTPRRSSREVLVMTMTHGSNAWAIRRQHVTSKIVVRALGSSLDRKLAAGAQPESSRLLAVRAQQLLTRQSLSDLAGGWAELLARCRRPPAPRSPRAPLCRDRILLAEPLVRELLSDLGQRQAAVRGVAMASALLGDGTGPLFNRRSEADLGMALRRAIAALDPIDAIASFA